MNKNINIEKEEKRNQEGFTFCFDDQQGTQQNRL